jgi:hypothetical protein
MMLESLDSKYITDRLLQGPGTLFTGLWRGSVALWAFGLIDKAEYQATSAVRDIRNAFAHTDTEIDFAHKDVIGPIGKLRRWLATVENVIGGPSPWWREALKNAWEQVADPPNDKHVFLGSAMMLQLMYANMRWEHEGLG